MTSDAQVLHNSSVWLFLYCALYFSPVVSLYCMLLLFKKKSTLFAVCFLFLFPFTSHAVFDFGGWVTNLPGAPGSIMSAFALPTFPPPMVFSFWYPVPGVGCLNDVQEVNQKQSLGVPQPPILLQFIGQYTFSKGPAMHPGQQILGKYAPVPMVCMANFVSWKLVPCGATLCPIPIVTPTAFFAAPLIIFNGSSI